MSLFFVTSFIFVAPSVSALTCTSLVRSLSKGSENSEVLTLQQFLADGGYLVVKPNGYFGENTKKAVIAFQRKQKISGTGFVGPITRGKIQEISCSIATSSTSSVEKKIPSESTVADNQKNATSTTAAVVVKDIPVAAAVQEIPTIYIKTLIPKDITPNEATLLGSGGIDGEKHWFEWGKTMEMSNVTPQTAASTSYSYKIKGLLPGTAYSFRAVTSVATSTERKGEVAYGDTRYFTTPPATVAATPVPTVSISSTGVAVAADGSARVKWVSANVSTCSFLDGEEGGNWTRQGSLSGEYITKPMTKSATFRIICKNNVQYTVTGSITVPKIVN